MSRAILEGIEGDVAYIGKNVNRKLLWTSLLMIFAGAVVAGVFERWYAIVGGTVLAVVGCYLNQISTKWYTEIVDKVKDEAEPDPGGTGTK